MPVDRLLPSEDAADLIALTRDIADKVLDPIVDQHERDETYPDGVFAQLGAAGLLSLPQPEEWGGGKYVAGASALNTTAVVTQQANASPVC